MVALDEAGDNDKWRLSQIRVKCRFHRLDSDSLEIWISHFLDLLSIMCVKWSLTIPRKYEKAFIRDSFITRFRTVANGSSLTPYV
jgi:hypothetical protein